MSVRHIAAIGLCLLGTAAALSAQDRGAPNIPSTITPRSGEVWSEVGLRAVNDARLVEAAGQRSRVRLLTRDQKEVVIEGSTFTITNSGKGVTIKSVGGATVTMTDPRLLSTGRTGTRRMEAHSVEVAIASDGWGYFRAVRHPS